MMAYPLQPSTPMGRMVSASPRAIQQTPQFALHLDRPIHKYSQPAIPIDPLRHTWWLLPPKPMPFSPDVQEADETIKNA